MYSKIAISACRRVSQGCRQIIADIKAPLGRPRDESYLRRPDVQELATELRDLLTVKETN